MKRIFAVLALSTLAIGFQVHAKALMTCTNGSIDKVGDNYFQVEVLDNALTISPYESSFTVVNADLGYADGTYSIINKTVAVSAEGEESSQLVNALLVMNAKTQKLNVTISYDKGAFNSYELTCKVN
jgi:hypothetical protein